MQKRRKKRVSAAASLDVSTQKVAKAKATVAATPPEQATMAFMRWSNAYSYAFLAAATTVLLLPFSSRAFHIDDTLFVAAARQISQHPLDPYGFETVWDTTKVAMSDVTQNPPLASYYIALIAHLLGWSERALHVGFILVAIALVLGTHSLARKFTALPMLASLCTLLTPGVLVSAGSVMCDTMMLSIWIWAAYFWIEGLDSGRSWFLAIAAVLVSLSALTKYFGAALVPLLFAYSLIRFRRFRTRLLFLLIPAGFLSAYELWTADLYGHGLLQGAAVFAQTRQEVSQASWIALAIVGLSFTGGCSLVGASFAPLLWSKKQIAIAIAVSGIAAWAIAAGWVSLGFQAQHFPSTDEIQRPVRWFTSAELVLCVLAGIFVLCLAGNDFAEEKDANSSFLGLWTLGTFYFATFVNWSVNARSVLPLIPVAAILLARRFDNSLTIFRKTIGLQIAVILLASTALSLWIMVADTEMANDARSAATQIHHRTHDKGGAVWFVGHWGFQHYMESFGGVALDPAEMHAQSGDFIAIPENNYHLAHIKPAFIASKETFEFPVRSWATTVSSELGAGFYSSYWGPLPYVIGPIPPERYALIRLANIPAQSAPR